MLGLVIGFVVGTIFGMFIFALCMVENERGEDYDDKD
jgi:type III secretory pathway component EscT